MWCFCFHYSWKCLLLLVERTASPFLSLLTSFSEVSILVFLSLKQTLSWNHLIHFTSLRFAFHFYRHYALLSLSIKYYQFLKLFLDSLSFFSPKNEKQILLFVSIFFFFFSTSKRALLGFITQVNHCIKKKPRSFKILIIDFRLLQ